MTPVPRGFIVSSTCWKGSMLKLRINSSVCTGCMNCVSVCSLSRSGRQHRGFSAVRVNLELFTGLHRHIWCRQCKEAMCASSCPSGAISLAASTGAWKIDPSICSGCGICVEACPFHAIFFTEGMQFPVKCDLCDGEPLCAEACNFQAITVIEEKN